MRELPIFDSSLHIFDYCEEQGVQIVVQRLKHLKVWEGNVIYLPKGYPSDITTYLIVNALAQMLLGRDPVHMFDENPVNKDIDRMAVKSLEYMSRSYESTFSFLHLLEYGGFQKLHEFITWK